MYIYIHIYNIYILVGGFNPSEKYQSVGIIIPNLWKNKIHVPVTTNRYIICQFVKDWMAIGGYEDLAGDHSSPAPVQVAE